MQLQQISHSPDIKQLLEEGYQIEVCGAHLLARHIPYLNSQKEIMYGTLVCILTLLGPTRVSTPPDHTIYFQGSTPHNADGTPINAIINNTQTQKLTETITVNHYFSSKPKSGNYPNYFEKIRTYSEILCSQAKAIDNTVTYKPNQKKAA